MIHPLVKELLPLYADDAVNPDVKRLIEDHLKECGECQAALRQLSEESWTELSEGVGNLPPVGGNEAPAFIGRLKRLVLGITLLGILAAGIVWAAGWYGGREATENEQQLENEELIRMDHDLISLSPPQDQILKQAGIRLTVLEKQFTPKQSLFRYRYDWSNPEIDYVREDIYWPNHLVAMDLTHNEVLPRVENASSAGHNEDEEAWILQGIKSDTKEVGIELPSVAVFYKPAPFRMKLEPQGETLINQDLKIHDIPFRIEKAEVGQDNVTIYYRQLEETQKTGLYLLSFNLKDAEGQEWSKEPRIDFQTGDLRKATIPRYRGMKGPLELQLEHGVLVAPGLHFKFSVAQP